MCVIRKYRIEDISKWQIRDSKENCTLNEILKIVEFDDQELNAVIDLEIGQSVLLGCENNTPGENIFIWRIK